MNSSVEVTQDRPVVGLLYTLLDHINVGTLVNIINDVAYSTGKRVKYPSAPLYELASALEEVLMGETEEKVAEPVESTPEPPVKKETKEKIKLSTREPVGEDDA